WVLRPSGSGFTFFLPVDDQEPENPGPLDPPIAGTLVVGDAGALHVSPLAVTTKVAQFTFERTTGCASWPEIGTQISGPVAQGPSAYSETQGYLDAHLHGMAFEFLG